jgi:DNA-binding NarL/FixJ family response regulator
MTVHCEARHEDEILDVLSQNKVDVVIMEILFRGEEGLETLEKLKRLHPKIAVLIFTICRENEYALRALKSGAAAYLTKDSALDELIVAVGKISRGGKYLNETLAAKLTEHVIQQTGDVPHEKLSNREHQILRLIAMGRPLKGIAADLGLSSSTVSTYRSRILEKMKLKTDADLVRYGFSRVNVEGMLHHFTVAFTFINGVLF